MSGKVDKRIIQFAIEINLTVWISVDNQTQLDPSLIILCNYTTETYPKHCVELGSL